MLELNNRALLQFAPASPFARDVNRKGHEILALLGGDRFGGAAEWMRIWACAILGVSAYGFLLHGVGNRWLGCVLIIVAAFAAFMLIVQAGHDAAHGALSSRRWINRLAVFLIFAVVGVDGALWRDRHVRLHHRVANLPGTGIDADSVSILRLAPDKPWKWWMRLQPIYGPAVYALGHISLVWIEDFASLLELRREGRREFLMPQTIPLFVLGKALHVALFLVLPWFMLTPTVAALLLGYLLASSLIAICFVILVVGTHVSDLAAFPLPDANGRLPHDWATHQLITSVDWSPTSLLAVLLTGGANAHVAHHLFPGHNHRHMAVLSRIVAECAATHGLHHEVTSFAGMVRGHWRHLVGLGSPPAGRDFGTAAEAHYGQMPDLFGT